ncbi:hypothetical protein Bca4012_074579 [Brassica carinata]
MSGQFSMDQIFFSRQNRASDRTPSPEPPQLSVQSPAPPLAPILERRSLISLNRSASLPLKLVPRDPTKNRVTCPV